MNVDFILETFERQSVDALLIGGMNFLLRHHPVLTFDIDFWVGDTEENLTRVATALRALDARWGRTEATWGPVPDSADWLRIQSVFCLTSPHGAIDIFRAVEGLPDQYDACAARATLEVSPGGARYRSLSDVDMLSCQLALPESLRRLDRTRYLKNLLDSQ
jgi:hypothetical protein